MITMIMSTMLMVMMIFVRMRIRIRVMVIWMTLILMEVLMLMLMLQDEDTRGSFASHGTSTPERGIKPRFVVCLVIFCNTYLWLSLHQHVLNC